MHGKGMAMGRWFAKSKRRCTAAQLAAGKPASGEAASLQVSFCMPPWQLWRSVSQRADAPEGALTIVESTPFRVHREWREPRQTSIRALAEAAGSVEDAVMLLQWMADSGQARWDPELDALVLTYLAWLSESGLAAVDYDRHTLVLGAADEKMARMAGASVAPAADPVQEMAPEHPPGE
jgi:hypothetical protein